MCGSHMVVLCPRVDRTCAARGTVFLYFNAYLPGFCLSSEMKSILIAGHSCVNAASKQEALDFLHVIKISRLAARHG